MLWRFHLSRYWVPAVAASGMIAANTLAKVSQHRQLINDVLGS